MPITLEGNAERGAVIGETCKGCHGIPGYFNAQSGVPRAEARRPERRLHRGRAARLSARHARPRDDAGAGLVAVGSGHRRRRGVLRPPSKASPSRPRTPASAAAIEAGRTKAATCVACHGPEGVAAAPQWPNLAGQHENYLLAALGQYKDGQPRRHGHESADGAARRGKASKSSRRSSPRSRTCTTRSRSATARRRRAIARHTGAYAARRVRAVSSTELSRRLRRDRLRRDRRAEPPRSRRSSSCCCAGTRSIT